MEWGREQGAEFAHAFTLIDNKGGIPACDLEDVRYPVKKSTVKPLCPECVELVGEPKKSS